MLQKLESLDRSVVFSQPLRLRGPRPKDAASTSVWARRRPSLAVDAFGRGPLNRRGWENTLGFVALFGVWVIYFGGWDVDLSAVG